MGMLRDIGEAVCDLVSDVFSSFGGSGGVVEANTYNKQTSTIDDTKEINKILEEVRTDYKKKLEKLENIAIDYSIKNIDKIIELLNNEFEKKYMEKIHNSDRILKRLKDRISLNIEEIKKNFSSKFFDPLDHLSLSDERCLEILNISDKKRKKSELEKYLNALTEETINNFLNYINNMTEKSMKFINEEIESLLFEQKNNSEKLNKELNDNLNLKGEELKEKLSYYDNKKNIIDNLGNIIIK